MKIHKVLLLAAALLVALHPARATVPSTTCFLQYVLSTNPQALTVSFVFQNAGDLLVLDTRAPAAPVTLTLNSDYTVTGGSGSTGTINTVPGGANGVQVGDVITVSRAVPLTQTTSFTNTGPLTASMIGQAFDKVTQIAQQVNLNGLRSLQFQGDEIASGVMPLAARKGNVVGFDSNGALTFYAFVSGAVLPISVQGTANEVLVNGSSGTPTTGAIILTTPQAIGTGSTVQFQKMGIGATPSANNDLAINHSVPLITAQASVSVAGSLIAPVATDLHPNAYRDTTSFTASVDADAYASYDAQTTLNGTHAYNHYYGYQARHNYMGSGSVDVMAGFQTSMTVSGGTANHLRGFYVSDPLVSGGTVTQFDGIYIDQLTAGTTRTAINIAGNDNIFMGGGQIFTSVLLAPITTTSRFDATFDQSSQVGMNLKNKNATATGTFVNFYNSSTVVQGSISQTNSTTTAFNTTSDARLKENIRPLSDSGSLIDRMRPRLYDWRWGGKNFHGFVAQELHEVYPEAVTVGDDGSVVTIPWSVDYSKLTPVIVAELQDLRRRDRNLEVLVGALSIFVIAQAGVLAWKTNRRRNP